MIPQAEIRRSFIVDSHIVDAAPVNAAHVGPVFAFRGFKKGRPVGCCVFVASPYQLRRFFLKVDLVLELSHLVADVVVATDVGVWPGPETKIGHEPLIHEVGNVSGLGVGPDRSVLADDVVSK